MNFTLRRQECQSTKNKQTKTKNMTTDEQNTLLKENYDKNPAHSTMGGKLNWNVYVYGWTGYLLYSMTV